MNVHQQLQKTGIAVFSVRVRPGTSITRWKEPLADGTLKLDLAAQAEDGEANAELIRFLADEFGVPKMNIEIVSGVTSRMKKVRIAK